jgi:hypothetical protein
MTPRASCASLAPRCSRPDVLTAAARVSLDLLSRHLEDAAVDQGLAAGAKARAQPQPSPALRGAELGRLRRRARVAPCGTTNIAKTTNDKHEIKHVAPRWSLDCRDRAFTAGCKNQRMSPSSLRAGEPSLGARTLCGSPSRRHGGISFPKPTPCSRDMTILESIATMRRRVVLPGPILSSRAAPMATKTSTQAADSRAEAAKTRAHAHSLVCPYHGPRGPADAW